MLARWLKSVPDVEERFRIADQFGDKARDVQLEAIITLKDKRKLVSIMNKLTTGSVNYLRAQALLSNSVCICPITIYHCTFRLKSGRTEQYGGRLSKQVLTDFETFLL